MSDVSSISSSLLTSLLKSPQSSLIQGANSQTQDAEPAAINDIVSLLGGSGASTDSLYGLLGGSLGSDSSDTTYNLLLAGANAQLMKENPTLMQAILWAREQQTQASNAQASSDPAQSQGTSPQALQDLQNTNLLTITPENLASLLEKYLQARNESAAANTTGSQINQSV